MDRVLTVEKQPGLRLVCIERLARVTLEVAGQTKQKSSQASPAISSTSYCPLGSVIVEIELAGAVRIAGHAQVIRIADVCTEFNAVLAAHVRPIIHKLVLMFLLDEGAVALVHVQGVAKKELRSSGLLDGERRHSRGNRVQVNTWYASVCGGCCAKAPGAHIHPVAHVAEADIRQECRA